MHICATGQGYFRPFGTINSHFLCDIVQEYAHLNWFTVKRRLICLLYKQRDKKELIKYQLDRSDIRSKCK